MSNEDKMLSQFGAAWVTVRDSIKENALKSSGSPIPYNPLFFVLTEKRTKVPANDVKSMIDYALQIGYLKMCRSKEYVKF